MCCIDVFYLQFSTPLPTPQWQRCLHSLPEPYRHKVTRFRHWPDQHAALLSLLLLRHALIGYGLSSACLSQLKRNDYGRPFIEASPVDFNITHSGEYVLCALTPLGRVGVDIEYMKPIKISDFKACMTPAQWQALTQSQFNNALFYDYWTIKESVIKADGRGLNIPLETIHTEPSCAYVDDAVWFIHKLAIDDRYAAHVATDQPQAQLRLHRITEITDNHQAVLLI